MLGLVGIIWFVPETKGKVLTGDGGGRKAETIEDGQKAVDKY